MLVQEILTKIKLLWLKLRNPGSVVRSFSIASSWNAVIILSQFVLSPIVTRIYGPGEYGVFAIFNSIVFNISILGTLKYAEIIVLQDSTKRKNIAIGLCVMVLTVVSVVATILLLFLKGPLQTFFNEPRITDFLWLIPVAIFFTGGFDIFLNVNISDKRFFRNGLAGFVNAAGGRLANIAYGLTLGVKSIGLILGDIIGKVLSLIALIFSSDRVKARLQHFKQDVSLAGMKAMAIEFKSFPLYFLPSSMLIVISGHLPIFFFQWKFGAVMVGSFGLASSMLEIFNRLIPYSFAPVFLQKANELKSSSPELLARKVYLLFLGMLAISTTIFSGFALLGDFVFPFVFGPKWEIAGEFSAILALSYVFNFVAISLSEVYNVMGRQRQLFHFTVVGVLLRIVAIAIILMINISPSGSLLIYSGVSSLAGIILILGVFLVLDYPLWKVIGFLVLSLGIVVVFLFLGGLF